MQAIEEKTHCTPFWWKRFTLIRPDWLCGFLLWHSAQMSLSANQFWLFLWPINPNSITSSESRLTLYQPGHMHYRTHFSHSWTEQDQLDQVSMCIWGNKYAESEQNANHNIHFYKQKEKKMVLPRLNFLPWSCSWNQTHWKSPPWDYKTTPIKPTTWSRVNHITETIWVTMTLTYEIMKMNGCGRGLHWVQVMLLVNIPPGRPL